MGLEFGWHHEAESLSSQSRGTGAFYHFAPAVHPGQRPASHEKGVLTMAKMTPRTLSGFMELLPGPQQQMERIMEILRRT